MKSSRLFSSSDILLALAAPLAVVTLFVAALVGIGVRNSHQATLGSLAAPLDKASISIDDKRGSYSPPNYVPLAQALKAIGHDLPGTKVVAGTAKSLWRYPKGTIAVSVTGHSSQRFSLSYLRADGRVESERLTPTVAWPDGQWLSTLEHPHWRSGRSWFLILLGVGESAAALLALMALLLHLAARGTLPTDERKRWQERVPLGGEFGPAEMRHGFTVYAAENRSVVNESAGAVTLQFVVKPYSWNSNLNQSSSTRGGYWQKGYTLGQTKLPRALVNSRSRWPADTEPAELSAAWFDFCHAVAEWNRAQWSEQHERELWVEGSRGEREERLAAQLKSAELLAAPEPGNSFLPGSVLRGSAGALKVRSR